MEECYICCRSMAEHTLYRQPPRHDRPVVWACVDHTDLRMQIVDRLFEHGLLHDHEEVKRELG